MAKLGRYEREETGSTPCLSACDSKLQTKSAPLAENCVSNDEVALSIFTFDACGQFIKFLLA